MLDTNAPIARVGNYTLHKTAAGYAIVTLDGMTVDVRPTARQATDAAVARIAAAYAAR